jgi:predicted metal-binding protein
MYGKKDGCPPNVPYVTEVLDLDKPVWFVYSEFDLSEHVGNMQGKHPSWSEKQLRCCFYWQRKSRNQLLHRVCEAEWFYVDANFHTFVPEALGINVYRTCNAAGVKLESIKRLKICRHVAFLGSEVE